MLLGTLSTYASHTRVPWVSRSRAVGILWSPQLDERRWQYPLHPPQRSPAPNPAWGVPASSPDLRLLVETRRIQKENGQGSSGLGAAIRDRVMPSPGSRRAGKGRARSPQGQAAGSSHRRADFQRRPPHHLHLPWRRHSLWETKPCLVSRLAWNSHHGFSGTGRS